MSPIFTKLPPRVARLQTQVCRHGSGAEFTAGGKAWKLLPIARAGRHGAAVYGKIGETEFTFFLGEPEWRVAVCEVLDLPYEFVENLPEQLPKAALEWFTSDLLSNMEHFLGVPVSIRRLDIYQTASLNSAIPLSMVCEDGLRVTGALTFPEVSEEWITSLEMLLASSPARCNELPRILPITAMICLSSWRMPLGELNGLEIGDVALSPAGPECHVVIGKRLRCAATLDRGTLVIKGSTMTEVGSEISPEPMTENQEQVYSIDSAEVEVQANVGRVTITLSQLKQLGIGQTLEFGTPVETPATLLVNGLPIAFGELVDVGGRVGVRIASMAEQVKNGA